MKLISFNVNGIRSITGKLKNGEKKGSMTHNGLKDLIEEHDPDILCLQEVKTQHSGDLAVLTQAFPHLYYTFSKTKKGYSGVAMATWLGHNAALKIAGAANQRFALDGLEFPTVALYNGNPNWFLPIIGGWYRLRDRIDRLAA